MQPEQQAILKFINHYPDRYPPTIQEIGQAVGIYNTTSVYYHLNELEKSGYTKLRAYKPRFIKLT